MKPMKRRDLLKGIGTAGAIAATGGTVQAQETTPEENPSNDLIITSGSETATLPDNGYNVIEFNPGTGEIERGLALERSEGVNQESIILTPSGSSPDYAIIVYSHYDVIDTHPAEIVRVDLQGPEITVDYRETVGTGVDIRSADLSDTRGELYLLDSASNLSVFDVQTGEGISQYGLNVIGAEEEITYYDDAIYVLSNDNLEVRFAKYDLQGDEIYETLLGPGTHNAHRGTAIDGSRDLAYLVHVVGGGPNLRAVNLETGAIQQSTTLEAVPRSIDYDSGEDLILVGTERSNSSGSSPIAYRVNAENFNVINEIGTNFGRSGAITHIEINSRTQDVYGVFSASPETTVQTGSVVKVESGETAVSWDTETVNGISDRSSIEINPISGGGGTQLNACWDTWNQDNIILKTTCLISSQTMIFTTLAAVIAGNMATMSKSEASTTSIIMPALLTGIYFVGFITMPVYIMGVLISIIMYLHAGKFDNTDEMEVTVQGPRE